MDYGAATPDLSGHTALSKVHSWGQIDRSSRGQCAFFFYCFLVRLGCNQRRGGVERGGEGQTEGRAAQSQKEGEHSSRHPSRTVSVVTLP